jgi:protein O-GlcNAc transferase
VGAPSSRPEAGADFRGSGIVIETTQQPGDADLRAAELLFHAQRYKEAIAACDRALAAAPDHQGFLHLRAVLAVATGDGATAERCLLRIVAQTPNDVQARQNLGAVLAGQKKFREAIEHFQAALAVAPDHVGTLTNYANALRELDRIKDAIDTFQRILAIEPDNDLIAGRLAHQLERACAWNEAATLRRRHKPRIDPAIEAGKPCIELPFAQLAYEQDPASILRVARAWSADIVKRAGAPLPPPTNDRDPARRLRIGFLSHDFRNHAVAELVRGVLARLDRASVHVTAWSTGPDDNQPMRKAITSAVDAFRDIGPLSDRTAAEAIRRDATDILVDLSGHTAGSRLEIAALRPAPVQVSWLGYPATTGAPFIDWLIADRTVLPLGEERFYSEGLCRLPDAYLPLDDAQPVGAPPTRASQNLPDEGFVFCSFNNMHKIEPVMFGLWMDLLREVPGSVLWLHVYNELAATNLRNAAREADIDPARLVYANRPPKEAHLARAGLADLALDTRLYNGHTTTIDMLWAGVPVVTLPGTTFQARVSASLVKAANLTDTIARDLEDYRRIALTLAREPERLAALKAKLAANRTRAPLFDTGLFARKLEIAFREIWRLRCAGSRPATLDIGAVA